MLGLPSPFTGTARLLSCNLSSLMHVHLTACYVYVCTPAIISCQLMSIFQLRHAGSALLACSEDTPCLRW